MKITFGQIVTLVTAFGGVIPIAVNFFNSAKESYQTCLAAITPTWALGLLLVSAVTGVFSKGLIDTFKESGK